MENSVEVKNVQLEIFENLKNYSNEDIKRLCKLKRVLLGVKYALLAICVFCFLGAIFFGAILLVRIDFWLYCILGILYALAFGSQHTEKIRPAMIASIIQMGISGIICCFLGVVSFNIFALIFGIIWILIAMQIWSAVSEKRLFGQAAPSYAQLKYIMKCKEKNVDMNIAEFPERTQSAAWTTACCIFLWINVALTLLWWITLMLV